MPNAVSYAVFCAEFGTFLAALYFGLSGRASPAVVGPLLIISGILSVALPQHVAAVEHQPRQAVSSRPNEVPRPRRWFKVLWGVGLLVLGLWRCRQVAVLTPNGLRP